MRLLFLLFAILLQAAERPPVLVIALDGFRHDYASKFEAPNMAKISSRAARFQPVFPTTTFPNFYSMVTGLLPERHGIVGMTFYEGERRFRYSETAAEGRWYGGEPIWTRVKTATYFWPGSEAEIGGKRPWRWFPYDAKTTHEQKLQQVREWAALPAGERPELIMVYFADIDSAAHANGPDAAETRAAVARCDASTGALLALGLDTLIVSDHGMSAVSGAIDLTPLADFSKLRVANDGPMVRLFSDDAAVVEATWRALKAKAKAQGFTLRRARGRAGNILVIPNGKQGIFVNTGNRAGGWTLKGTHGFDAARNPEMNGVLYATGPGIRPNTVAAAARTPDLYRLIERMLGLPAKPGLDGKLGGLGRLLR